ncbi:MAG: endonuclease/exonuclease/phosphatase family protein [Prolixibacteraceae bacterium]
MKKGTVITWCSLMVILFLAGCQSNKVEQLTIVSYNVENLFDTVDDPKTKDDDFTPEGRQKWTQERYEKKIEDLSRVILKSGGDNHPSIIGLCEIENRKVLEDLIHTVSLKGGHYGISQFESPYYRGMDVALLYDTRIFKVKSEKVIPVTLLSNPKFSTRDILVVNGELSGEEYTFIVNHWSSRRGGSEKSEPKRMVAASLLRREVDRILSKDKNANIVIMGDMNEEPNEYGLHDILRAKDLPKDRAELKNDGSLYNMMFYYDKQGKGSYNYHGKWNMLDNIIVSSNVIKKEQGLGVALPALQDMEDHYPANIFVEDWFTYHSDLGMTSPSKTYGGPNYYGGFSDHYPVTLKLINK